MFGKNDSLFFWIMREVHQEQIKERCKDDGFVTISYKEQWRRLVLIQRIGYQSASQSEIARTQNRYDAKLTMAYIGTKKRMRTISVRRSETWVVLSVPTYNAVLISEGR